MAKERITPINARDYERFIEGLRTLRRPAKPYILLAGTAPRTITPLGSAP